MGQVRLFELEFANPSDFTPLEKSMTDLIKNLYDSQAQIEQELKLNQKNLEKITNLFMDRIDERWKNDSFKPSLSDEQLLALEKYVLAQSPTAFHELMNFIARQANAHTALPESKTNPLGIKLPMSNPNFKVNENIEELLITKTTKWDHSPKNMLDLRDYAFIKVTENNGRSVSFTFLTASNYTRICYQRHMDTSVINYIQAGQTYVIHNIKNAQGKNHWDLAILCDDTDKATFSKAKNLARVFAESN